MIYTVLIYLVFIFPLSFRAYSVDGNNRLRSLRYFMIFFIVSYTSCKGQGFVYKDFKSLGVKDMEIRGNLNIDFRDSIGKINWNCLELDKNDILSDSIIKKYFSNVDELKKWSGYQKCTIDGYSQIDDSTQIVFVTNKVLNGNEANKYLISFNIAKLNPKVFLLAKIEKSIDDLFEVYSEINSDTIKQVQIYKFIEGDSIITDSIVYKYKTHNFLNYNLFSKDSIRTIELISE
ncbi:MAG: hypothetical protein N4A72_20170 [Bacteroidales bacterium]|nr:hypothetical protein [Bacteroidales bacterium]